MPRAAPNRPSRAAAPYQRSSTNPEPQRLSSESAPGDRRESGLRALSRRISQVFSRAAGRPANLEPDAPVEATQDDARAAQPAESSEMLADTSLDSQHSVASRAPSASRKASVNLSLLRSQRDMRLPAHMIVEAYREALREKAEAAAVQKRVASSSPSATPGIPQRKVAKTDRPSERNSLASMSSSSLPARKSKPVKHKIQLVTKPVLDLSMIPEDRKNRPGFISANFDVSDDDSDGELETAKQKEPAATLVRRPQVASDKLQRALTEAPATTLETQTNDAKQPAPPAFGLSSSKESGLNGSSKAAEPLKAPSQNDSGAPKFSFAALGENKPPTSSESDANLPKFSFNASNSAATDSGPKFAFGANASAAANNGPATKPLFGSQDPSNTKPAEKPQFSFGASTNNDSNKSQSTDDTAQKPAFSFGSAPGAAAEKPSFSFGGGAASKPSAGPTFSFGAKNGDSAQKPDEKPTSGAPTFSLGAKPADAPKFNFGANGSSNTAAEAPASANAPSKPLFSFGEPSGDKQPASGGPSEAKPALSFGSSTTDANKGSGQEMAFNADQASKGPSAQGSDINQKPASGFSFSAPAANGDKPAFNFGAANGSANSGTANGGQQGQKPMFSFGASATGNSGADDKPAATGLNFGAPQSKSDDKPKFAFGSSSNDSNSTTNTATKPAFSFGAPNGASAQPESKPAATFGATDAPAGQSQSFSFGTKPASPAPFGANSATPAAFSFGAPKQTTPGASSGPSSATQPAFSFGGASSTTFGGAPAPGQQPFGFGAQQQPTAQQPPSFQFGGAGGASAAPGNSKATTPFAFGSPAPAAGGTPPSFAFGQPQGAPGAAGQLGSRETTPGPGASQQRKIAQVKRRLRR